MATANTKPFSQPIIKDTKVVDKHLKQNAQHTSELPLLKKKLLKDIDSLTSKSKTIRSPKKAIELIAGALCNNFFSKELWADRKPFSAMEIKGVIYTDFRNIESSDLEAIIDMAKQVEQLFIKSEPFEDVFTELMAQYCGKDKNLQQNFTPMELANVLSRFAPNQYEQGKPLFIADPTGCGTGNLLLGKMHQFYIENGADAMRDLHVIGMDLDLDLVRIAIVQVMSHALVHGINLGSVEFHFGNAVTDYSEDTLAFYHSYSFMNKRNTTNPKTKDPHAGALSSPLNNKKMGGAMAGGRSEISKLIEKIASKHKGRKSVKQVFDDIIQLTFNIVFSAPFQMSPKAFTPEYDIDKSLFKELADYKNNPEAWNLLQKAVICFIKLFTENEPFTDIMGVMYDEYLGDVLGQFFTPTDAAQLAASLSISLTEKAPATIGDVTGCGGGGLILAQLSAIMDKYGKEKLAEVTVECMDIDIIMVQLCAIQVMLGSMMKGIAIKSLNMHHGNCLTDYNKKTGVLCWIPNPQLNAFNKLRDRILN